MCSKCFQPSQGCYCSGLSTFDSGIEFIILIHPAERRRRIASGRMSHLMLENSRLIAGEDFSGRREVDEIIADSRSVILYPGPTSVNLTAMSTAERGSLFSDSTKLNVFVIDGTWSTARKMIRSKNLAGLERISFEMNQPSRFGRVRKQPAPGCFSTIEAIHHTIELLGETRGFDVESRKHDVLLNVFDSMVQRQMTFVEPKVVD
ncbi:MAG: tRNA-uridine aminocarboxypropyltransferase [Bdellovibrionota bacterium]